MKIFTLLKATIMKVTSDGISNGEKNISDNPIFLEFCMENNDMDNNNVTLFGNNEETIIANNFSFQRFSYNEDQNRIDLLSIPEDTSSIPKYILQKNPIMDIFKLMYAPTVKRLNLSEPFACSLFNNNEDQTLKVEFSLYSNLSANVIEFKSLKPIMNLHPSIIQNSLAILLALEDLHKVTFSFLEKLTKMSYGAEITVQDCKMAADLLNSLFVYYTKEQNGFDLPLLNKDAIDGRYKDINNYNLLAINPTLFKNALAKVKLKLLDYNKNQ